MRQINSQKHFLESYDTQTYTKICVFRDVIPCSLGDTHRRVASIFWWWRQQVCSETSTCLPNYTASHPPQKTDLRIFWRWRINLWAKFSFF